jgi:hypothetical protein
MSAPDDRRSVGAPLVGRDATVDGGTTALLMAAAAALLIGAASGSLAGMAAGVGGAVATVVGVIRVADADPVSRGVGSVALLVGAVFAIRGLAVSVGGPGFLLVVCGSIGVLAIAVETLPGGRVPPLRPALYSLFGSAGVLLVAGVAFLGLAPLLENVGVVSGLFSARGGRFANVLPSVLVLQVLIVVLSLSIDRARDVLRRWIPDKRTDRFSVLDRLGVEAGNIPRELWAFLGVQVILVLLLPGIVTAVLRETAPGEALYVLLTGGVLHLLVLALILPFAGVIGGEAVRHLVVRVSGYHPPTVIGLLAGGLVAAMGSFVLAVLAGLGVDVTWVTEAVSPPEVIGLPGGGAILSIAVGVAVFGVALRTGGLFARRVIGPHSTGVFGGTTLLFVTAVIGSEMGVHPVVVFVTVGLGLAALEAGSRSSRLSRRLGPSVDARSAELVHLLGSTVAIAIGIGLATATLYLVVPVAVGLGNTRGIMLLIAGLMGLFAAVFLFGRESSAVDR